MTVIFLFIDGVGLGNKSQNNPFVRQSYGAFRRMGGAAGFTNEATAVVKDYHLFKPVDATLGMKGLPQSGTGQTTLFTGVNAAKVIGKHFGPFPHSGIKHLLREQSLFNKVQRMGKSMRFINAYPDVFFKRSRKRNRWSCTTIMTKSAGLPLYRAEDVRNEKALTAGLTQKAWREMLDLNVPVISPEAAADRLLRSAETTDLTLSEYYLTDKAGHGQNHKRAAEILSVYDRFLMQLMEKKKETDTLVLCSDHGNVEDLSTKTHTRNKVPLFVLGPGAEVFEDAESIMDVTPGIVRMLE